MRKMSIFLVCLGLLLSAEVCQGELIVNGGFDLDPILGAGQTVLAPGKPFKYTTRDPNLGPNYSDSIFGVQGWNYALPSSNGTHSDSGLGRVGTVFGLAQSGQQAYINNWNRMMSQTVTLPTVRAGDRLDATIDFGTIETVGARAGTFYLVAGTANPANLDVFSPGTILLDSMIVANPGWINSIPDMTTPTQTLVNLHLQYTFSEGDAALGRPITLAFRTEFGSTGPTYWDNASLTLTAVPEPSTLLLVLVGVAVPSVVRSLRDRTNRKSPKSLIG